MLWQMVLELKMSLKSRVEAVLFITARAAEPQEIADILNEEVEKVVEVVNAF